MTQNAPFDPLDSAGGTPAMSFKNAAPGTTQRLYVTGPGEKVHSQDYDTGKPAYWPANPDGSPGKPKMAAVYQGFASDAAGAVDLQNPLSLWATLPSAMATALKEGQTASGAQIMGGSVLDVQFTRQDAQKPGERKEGIKHYAVTHYPNAWQPPVQATQADPLSQPAAQPVQQQFAAPQAAPVQQYQQPAAMPPVAPPVAAPAAPAPGFAPAAAPAPGVPPFVPQGGSEQYATPGAPGPGQPIPASAYPPPTF